MAATNTQAGQSVLCLRLYFRYLGNDFIFSFIAVALIPVYYARKSVGWLLAALLTVGSFAITTYDIIHYDLGAYVFDDHYRSYAPCCAHLRRSSETSLTASPRYRVRSLAAHGLHSSRLHWSGTRTWLTPDHGTASLRTSSVCALHGSSSKRARTSGGCDLRCRGCLQRLHAAGAASRCIRITSALWHVPSYPVVTAINVAAVGVLFFIMFIVKTDFGEQANKWTGCDTCGRPVAARPFHARRASLSLQR